jgi:hypothetical protein
MTVIMDLHITQYFFLFVFMYLRTSLLQLEIIFDLYLSALVQLDESGIVLDLNVWNYFRFVPQRIFALENTSTRNYFGYGPEHLVMW